MKSKSSLTHMTNWKLRRLETEVFIEDSSIDHTNQLPTAEEKNVKEGTLMINLLKITL